jgi:salicylate hydroxylase
MTQNLDGPVAIIGAGIGGVPVRVFEQARALREIGAGVTITPNAMNVLDFLGIGPALAEQAGETPRYFVRSAADGRELERGPDPDSFGPEFGAGYCNLHRADLHVALTEAVTRNDPDAIALDHRFDDLEQDGAKVVARFSNGAAYEAPALIGADGGASAVRNAVFGGQDASFPSAGYRRPSSRIPTRSTSAPAGR